MSKYHNVRTEFMGRMFDSKKEAQYAQILEVSKKAKNPRDRVVSYECQVPFPIVVNGVKVCKYVADFRVYYDDGRVEVVDVKGVRTAIYKLKKRLVSAVYGIEIMEV